MQQSAVMIGLARAGSPRLTLVLLAALGLAAAASYGLEASSALLAPPLAALAANLGAAVIANPVFRRQPALLAFHLALLVLVLLVLAGRLTYLSGRVELTQGVPFEGDLVAVEAGPLHPWRLAELRFVNEGFRIRYVPGLRRGPTENRVRWRDASGVERSAVIGDQRPLVLAGYRFYTTPNKGFAPLFAWHPAGGGAPLRGAVHLPSYPLNEFGQAREWEPPGSGQRLWVMLRIEEPVLDPGRESVFRLPKRHRLVVRAGEERRELAPGERLALPGGTLVYEGLTTWMGYKVFYDWTRPWLLAACLVAAGTLGWHYWRKFRAAPW